MSVSVCYHESYTPVGKGRKQAWAEEPLDHSVAPPELSCRGKRSGICPLQITESWPAPACGLGLLSGMKRLLSLEASPTGSLGWKQSDGGHCNTGISLVISGTERIGCDASAGRSLCLRAGWFREVRWPAERWGQRLFSSSRWRYWGWHAGNRGVGEEEWQNTRFTSLWTPFCSGLERCFCHLPVIYLPLLRVASLVSAADEIKAAPSPLTCRASFPCPRPKDPHSVTPPVCLLSSHFSFLPGKFVKCVQSRGCGLKPPEQNSKRLAYCRSAVF